ncbi:hydantoinase/oxoprolinase family protein [Chloroflexota bacterium]
MTKKIGIDIGGTFTDIVVMDDITGEIGADKFATTPEDPAKAVIKYLTEKYSDLKDISLLTNGTTIATNAVIERQGAKLGLIVTMGHKDCLDIQRTNWLRIYDVTYQKPVALIPYEARREVSGRTLYDGKVIVPLEESEIIEAVSELTQKNQIEGICVCFLNSYVNPAQEQETKAIIMKHFPELYVMTSSETLAEVLEYERFSTAVVSAFLMPRMDKYLASLEDAFRGMGLPGERFMIMQGNGGMISSDLARHMAGYTVSSGPAAGVTGSQHLAGLLGIDNVITFDMGGTTTDVCLIRKGQPQVTLDYKVAGHPMRFPLLDIYSIGAGGGSIAWIDEGGGLHVGPQSAGADPGPACYARGGQQPTISDAHAILGRFTPEALLGGKIEVRYDLAQKAIDKIASYFNTDVEEAAASIIKIANESMLNALRVISIEKGIDPHDYVLVAYGGAGPMHAGALMKRLRLRKCIIPPIPGCHSALGLLTADIKHDYVQSILQPTAKADIDSIRATFRSLVQRGEEVMRSEGVRDEDILVEYKCDMRYIGQAYVPVIIPFSWDTAKENQLTETEKIFRRLHQEQYKHSGEQPTEIISLRISIIGKQKRPMLKTRGFHPEPGVWKRRIYFEDIDQFTECNCFLREELPVGFSIKGPSVIYQIDSVTLIYSGQRAVIDEYGDLIIEEME